MTSALVPALEPSITTITILSEPSTSIVEGAHPVSVHHIYTYDRKTYIHLRLPPLHQHPLNTIWSPDNNQVHAADAFLTVDTCR